MRQSRASPGNVQAAKSQLEVATSGIEATLYSIEVERKELSEMMTSVKANQSRALSQLQVISLFF